MNTVCLLIMTDTVYNLKVGNDLFRRILAGQKK